MRFHLYLKAILIWIINDNRTKFKFVLCLYETWTDCNIVVDFDDLQLWMIKLFRIVLWSFRFETMPTFEEILNLSNIY